MIRLRRILVYLVILVSLLISACSSSNFPEIEYSSSDTLTLTIYKRSPLIYDIKKLVDTVIVTDKDSVLKFTIVFKSKKQ